MGEGSGDAVSASLIAELRLHQVELEAQNRQLQAAQEELEDSRARYVSLFEFAPVAYLSVDLGTIVQELNLTAAALLRVERGRIIGFPLARFFGPEHQLPLRTRVAACIRTGTADPLESALNLPGRAPLDVQLQMSTCSDPVRGTRLCRIAVSDVSALVEARRAEALACDRYRGLIAGIPDAVLRVNAQGAVVDRHLPDDSARGLPVRATGAGLRQAVAPPVLQRVEEAVRRVFESGVPELVELAFQEEGDERRWVEVRAVPSGAGEVFLLFRDVSALRQAQQRLGHDERMAALGRVTAALAHQINNPLAFVLASLELCERDEAAARTALRDARMGVAAIRDVITSLREFSHPGEGEPVSIDPRAALESALKLASHELNHRARLDVRLEPVPSVRADASQLTHIFLNLLLNAAQAIPLGAADQNVVTIRTGVDSAGANVLVELSDTGRGMSRQVLSRVFEPFYTTKAVGEGMGLGLSVAYAAVRSLGGEIEVTSTEGSGSSFVVSLPAARPATQAQVSSGPAASAPVRRLRLLLIDDQPNFGRTVKALLQGSHDVVFLQAAAEALALLESGERFDVILCDLMMPVMTGQEFHERVVSFAPELARKILFMTGGAFGEAMQQFLQEGARTCLLKPFPIEELERALEQIARS